MKKNSAKPNALWYDESILLGGAIMRAIITVTGQDTVGILAGVTAALAKAGCNVVEVSQTVGQGIFSMFMVVETDHLTMEFSQLVSEMNHLGDDMGLSIRCMNEDVFTAMHHI